MQEKINDEQWWNENVEILKTLVIPFNLKSVNDLKSHFTINKEIITFAEKISKATDSDFIKHLEHEIYKLKIDIEHNNQELIPFYPSQLWDESYTDWDSFITQFDNLKWKEKNKAIIEKLAKILGCDYSAINHQKIADLDQIIVDMVKKLFDEKRANKLKKKWEKNEKQFEQSKKELIAIHLAQLWDGRDYSDYSFFDYINMLIKKFDDQEWKRKNELIITKLASVLNCSNEEINSKKIDDLWDGEICTIMRNKLKELADEKKKTKKLFEF